MPRVQVNSATLVMGVTGSGKSTLGATLARFVWETHKKVTLYYTSDGGGIPSDVQALVEAGIIWLFRMRTRDPGDLSLSFETCQRSCQGWWPRKIDPMTGAVEPGVEMVPPITKRWVMYCPQGHAVRAVPSQSMLAAMACPTCKVMTTKQNMRVTEQMFPTPGFEKVGARFYDGLSSMLSWELQEMGHRAGRLELKGEESAIGGKVVSGDLKFGGSTRAHVGFVQARGEELVHLTLGIQGMVVPPVFTALTMEASDDKDLMVIGPKISGRAKTDEAPQWFGNCLELGMEQNASGPGESRVLYLSEFTDVQGRRHLCKHRGAPGTMPDKLIDPPNNEGPNSQVNLGVFFQLLDVALTKRVEDVLRELPDAPGLPEGLMTFGDGTPVVETPAVEPSLAAVSGQSAAVTVAAPVATAAKPVTKRAPVTKGKAAAPAPSATTEPALPLSPATDPTPAEETAAPVQDPPAAPVVEPPPPAQAVPAAPAAPASAAVIPPSAAASAVRPGVAPRPPGAPRAPMPPANGPRPPAAAPRPPAAAPARPAAVAGAVGQPRPVSRPPAGPPPTVKA